MTVVDDHPQQTITRPPAPGRERAAGRPTAPAPAPAPTASYVAACAAGDGALDAVFEQLVLPPTYDAAYGTLRLARPLFVDHDEVAGFAADLGALYELIAALPARHFAGDVGAYCDALGIDPRQAELMRVGARGGLELYGRADAYHDGSSFKLLEFNVGSELGGIDAAQMNRAFLAVPAFRQFAERHELAFVDTAAILARALRRAARRVTARDEPVVALLDGPGGLRDHGHVFTAIQEALRAQGIELVIGEVQEVSDRGGKLALGGLALDVVLRYFTASELLEHPRGRAALTTIVRADALDGTALFTPLEHGLMETKANLALLHDPRVRASFSASEIALVDRVVPWTRTIGAGTPPAERARLVERCRAQRASLILKPGTGCGGVGALLGREHGDRDWARTLRSLAGEDYVVQELVTPAGEPVVDPVSGALEQWQANWGIFATTDGYAGAFVRALRARDGAVISYGNRATRGTCVFTHPTTTREA